MAEQTDLSVEVELPAEGEANPAAVLLVARHVIRRNRRALKNLARALDVDLCQGGRHLSDHQLAEHLINKAEILMTANARRMGTLTHQARVKRKPPTRH